MVVGATQWLISIKRYVNTSIHLIFAPITRAAFRALWTAAIHRRFAFPGICSRLSLSPPAHKTTNATLPNTTRKAGTGSRRNRVASPRFSLKEQHSIDNKPARYDIVEPCREQQEYRRRWQAGGCFLFFLTRKNSIT